MQLRESDNDSHPEALTEIETLAGSDSPQLRELLLVQLRRRRKGSGDEQLG
jgi:hypothetical protein